MERQSVQWRHTKSDKTTKNGPYHQGKKIETERTCEWWRRSVVLSFRCEIGSRWQTVPEIYHTLSTKILRHTTFTSLSLTTLVKTFERRGASSWNRGCLMLSLDYTVIRDLLRFVLAWICNQIKSNQILFEDNNSCQTALQGRTTCTNSSPKHNQRRNEATQNTQTK